MLSMNRMQRRMIAVAVIFLVIGLYFGASLYYVPNSEKPPFLVGDCSFSNCPDLQLAFDNAHRSSIKVVQVFSQAMYATSGENVTAEQMQDAAMWNQITSQSNIGMQYAAFASQHGIDPDMAWSANFAIVSNANHSLILMRSFVYYDGPSHVMTFSSSPLKQVSPSWDVTSTSAAFIAFFQDYQAQNFLRGSSDFLYYYGMGDISYSQVS